MGLFIRISQPAGNLIDLDVLRVCRKGKRYDPLVSFLLFHFAEINTSLVNTRRRSCLKPIHFDSKFFQTVCQIICRLQSVWPGLHADVSVNTSRL